MSSMEFEIEPGDLTSPIPRLAKIQPPHGNAQRMRTDHLETPPTHTRLLVAEDDADMRSLLASQLRNAGYEVVECPNGLRLVQQIASRFLPGARCNDYDLIISDIRMPGFSGLEVLDGMHDRADFPPMILITAFGDPATHARATQLGAFATLNKPFRIADLLSIVDRASQNPQHRGPGPGLGQLP